MAVSVDNLPRVVEPDLSGLRALITCGASGIGLACAQRLAAAGARVIVVDRDREAAEAVADRLGGRAEIVDLADMTAVEDIDCNVDILVNNAGVQHVAPGIDCPPETFARIQRRMVEAPFRMARRALPRMCERGWGRIINISSVHGVRASAYVTANHALEGLSKAIALEGAGFGVTSNCIDPANVRTSSLVGQAQEKAYAHSIAADQVFDQIMLAPTTIRPLIEPTAVADLAAYLCSPQAATITGASWAPDIGWTAL